MKCTWPIFVIGNPLVTVGIGLANHVSWVTFGILAGITGLVSLVEWLYVFEGYKILVKDWRKQQ